MKNYLPLIFFVTATLMSCNSGKLCSNEKLDGDETEIDCGGECEPCPPIEALSATVGGIQYNAASIYVERNGDYTQFSSTGNETSLGFDFFGLEAELAENSLP